MSSFLGQNILEPWYYWFASPGWQEVHRTTNVICMGKTYASVVVPPTIDSIGNAFGPVGTSFTVTIAGTGFRSAVGGVAKTSFAATGSGVTFSGVTVSNVNLATATVTIAANAVGGNRTVSVTVIPPSGPSRTSTGSGNKTFKVQIPTQAVEVANEPDLVTIDPTAASIIDGYGSTFPGGVRCGAYRNFGYVLKDQSGDTITEPRTVTEILSNFSINPNPNNYQGPTSNSTVTSDGTFWDLQFWGVTGNCPGLPPFSGSVNQGFKVDFGSPNIYTLTTVRHIATSKDSSGNYSIVGTTTTP
jgi:hypothetical protein